MANKISDLGGILKHNDYPGRGIVVGKSADGKSAVFAYFIMGRSENSRNRIFSETEDGIRTEAHDPSKMTDPSLIIYHPVRSVGERVIVTNGDQTDTIRDFLLKGDTFENALETRCFEPDEPNYTPRISAMLDFSSGFGYKMSILKACDEKGSACNRFTFSYAPVAGLGHFLHTYDGNGSPIPSFSGEPEAVLIGNDPEGFADMLWSSLNEDNKVSLYVRFTDLESGRSKNLIINKNH